MRPSRSVLRHRGGDHFARAGDVVRHSPLPRLHHQLGGGNSPGYPRDHFHQPISVVDPADLDRAAHPAVRLHRRSPILDRSGWMRFRRPRRHDGRSFNLMLFGAASTVAFSLIAQIGEQVDFLRFLPPRDAAGRRAWWIAYLAAGPGLDHPRNVQAPGGFVPRLCRRLAHFVPVRQGGRADADVSRGIPLDV